MEIWVRDFRNNRTFEPHVLQVDRMNINKILSWFRGLELAKRALKRENSEKYFIEIRINTNDEDFVRSVALRIKTDSKDEINEIFRRSLLFMRRWLHDYKKGRDGAKY